MASNNSLSLLKARQTSNILRHTRPFSGFMHTSIHRQPRRPYSSATDRLPLIIRPSFWRSMVPKPFRKKEREARMREHPPKEWNPATFFIMIFLLIGSNGIHFINLRQRYAISSRQADNKIALLQEVLKRVQAGEDVDVEKMLGTGDPLAEQEWQEVIKNIEEEDRLWKSKERRKARKQAKLESEAAAAAAAAADNSPTGSQQYSEMAKEFAGDDEMAPKRKRSPGFY